MKISEIQPPLHQRIRKVIDSLPKDEVLNSSEMAERLGVPSSLLRHAKAQLEGVSLSVHRLTTYYGKAEAIKKVKALHTL